MEEIRANVHKLVQDDARIMRTLDELLAEFHELHKEFKGMNDRVVRLESAVLSLEAANEQLGEVDDSNDGYGMDQGR